MTVNIYIYK